MTPGRRGGTRGFTLLEVLVALAVMGVVLGALARIGGVSARSGKVVVDNVETVLAEEQLALGVIGQIRRGQIPDMPDPLVMRMERSAGFSDRQRQELAARGVELVNVALVSTRTGRTAWHGQLLLPARLLAKEGGGQ